jgi:hypothetical protein
MILNLEEFPNVGEDFDIVTIDLMMYEPGAYTPLINYMNTNNDEEKVTSGMTMMTGMSFESYESAAAFFGTLVRFGFFIPPVSKIGFTFDADGDIIDEFNWEEIITSAEEIPECAPEGVSLH